MRACQTSQQLGSGARSMNPRGSGDPRRACPGSRVPNRKRIDIRIEEDVRTLSRLGKRA